MQPKGPDRRAVRSLAIVSAVAAWALAAAAHAQLAAPPPAAAASSDSLAVEDPFEKMNRRLYAVHEALDHALLHPLAIGYSHVTTAGMRKAVHNFVTELGEPVVFGNDLLQFRIKRAATTLGRFVVNATAGVGGLFDPATRMGLPHHDNGFGTTLGRYGVKPGPYLFVPLMGPTDFRDIIGTAMDFYSDPIRRVHYHERSDVMVGITVLSGLDERVNAEADLEQIRSMGTDTYATLRSLYMQEREADIRGGTVSINNLPNFDDPGAAAPAAGTPPAAATPAPTPPPPAATDPGVASPSAARTSAADPASGPDAAYFLTAPAVQAIAATPSASPATGL